MDEKYFVYVLRSQLTGRRYVSSCRDIADRLFRHNAGKSKSTKHVVPWILILTEDFDSRSEAVRREKFYKTGRGRERLDAMEVNSDDHLQVANAESR